MKVSDEVVEAFCSRFYGAWDVPRYYSEVWKKKMRDRVRAALEAAHPLVLGEPVAHGALRVSSGMWYAFSSVGQDEYVARVYGGDTEFRIVPLYAPKEQQP